jgi:hypothetical protein
MVVESIAREGSAETAPAFVEEYVVEAIGEFEGIKYPSRGHYTRHPSGVVGYRHDEFEVAAVKRIDAVTQKAWLIEFPPGTGVQDQVNGKTFMVPHDERVLSGARLRRLNAMQPKDTNRPVSP